MSARHDPSRWPRVAQLQAIAAALVLLAACGSDNGGGALTQAPGNDTPATGTLGPAFNIAISPATTPAYDPSIHDYTISCATTPTIQLNVVQPAAIGFSYLGTSTHPVSTGTPAVSQLHLPISILPNQRFSFSTDLGNYSVRCLPTNFPPLSASVTGTPQAQWYVFAPTIGTAASYAIIADAHGTPVWWMFEPSGVAIDVKVLGPNTVAWTLLVPEGGGGTYVLRDFSGQPLNTIGTNLRLDPHDLQPTPNGTYLAIQTVERVCPPDCADLSPWGGAASTAVFDAQIIEIDSNSNVLWTWRTRDHISLAEYGETGWLPTMGTDIIHMNAVEPDGTDALFFSARDLSAFYHVIKSTGAVDYKVGGVPRAESLTVVGETRPSATGVALLSGQHDVRKWSDGTVSVHDNGTLAQRAPTIVRYKIDTVARTATVVQEVSDVRVGQSLCCGSARLLPGGNWLVQWGANPFMTELDPSGNPVLTLNYNSGATYSYRAVPVEPGVLAAQTLREGMDAMAVAASTSN